MNVWKFFCQHDEYSAVNIMRKCVGEKKSSIRGIKANFTNFTNYMEFFGQISYYFFGQVEQLSFLLVKPTEILNSPKRKILAMLLKTFPSPFFIKEFFPFVRLYSRLLDWLPQLHSVNVSLCLCRWKFSNISLGMLHSDYRTLFREIW